MTDLDIARVTQPRIHLLRMLVFLVLAGFLVFILYKPIWEAFRTNPGLNGLIGGVLLIGIVLAFRQVLRLFREVRWVNSLARGGDGHAVKPPILLAPMAALIGERIGARAISPATFKAVLDSIGTRLDEGREILRYLAGLLVFLGLLGTFWGLIETVSSIGGVITKMKVGGDATSMFEELKTGLGAPLAGMGISFSASLFGLAGSLVLGFLDLQTGQAQNRFYNELEDRLSGLVSDAPATTALVPTAMSAAVSPELKPTLDRLQSTLADLTTSRTATQAMANLAEGIQGLVQHMRSEQQMIRDWVEAQSEQQREVKKLLDRISSQLDRRP